MATARSHEDLIVWQRANELKLLVYQLIKAGPIARDADLSEQLRRSAAAAPRLIAEGSLRDGVDREYFTSDQIEPLQRLSKRASKAATRLIAYLRTAKAPNESRRPRPTRNP